MTPTINILTRTSNRPNGFKICADSITNQTYDNIRHLVSYDNLKDQKYLNAYSHIETIYVDGEKTLREAQHIQDTIGHPIHKRKGKLGHYNFYMNHLLHEVKDGYYLILDDDDRLAHPKVIEEIVSHIVDEDTILIWQMKYANGKILPDNHSYQIKQPQINRIGSPCFLIHSKWKDDVKWDCFKGGDFRYLDKIYRKIPKSKWINKVMIHLSNRGEGWGNQRDI